MEHIFYNFPIEINKRIYSYLYEDKKQIDVYREKWKCFNKKLLVLMDMFISPYNCYCFYYLTIHDFNINPCWLCGEEGHPMKICYKYYRDVGILKKSLKYY